MTLQMFPASPVCIFYIRFCFIGAGHYRGSDVLRETCAKLGMSTKLMRSTKIRKFVSTNAQLLLLNATEREWLNDHMGHTEAVDKQWYRYVWPGPF